jgi:hypothetical protein
MAVCLELRKGPLVDARQPSDCLMLCPVHPTMLAKSRDAFCLSHAKDDPTDAAFASSKVCLANRNDNRAESSVRR